jgi:hypothetical protein
MALDITGKIIQILPSTTGTSKAGKDWVKQEFIVETQEAYPKKICIGLMGEKVQEIKKYVPGNEVKVSLNIESREYQGKWFTNINAWRIEPVGSSGASSGQAGISDEPMNHTEPESYNQEPSTDDLPF